jgi:cysteinyl-tRNA synthetase
MYQDFGQLDLDAQQATDRVDLDPRKRDQADFALWFSESKFANQIMKWDSPWGVGFPGWHIECSALASHYLGEFIDIHCGGVDHIRVHHTNEIAQSEACFGHQWVNYWLHGAFLILDDSKMSKSSGEFLHLDRLVADGFSPLDYRYLLLTAHYRSELRFSYDALKAAAEALRTLRNLVYDWRKDSERKASGSGVPPEQVQHHSAAFWEAVSDDLHLPRALAVAWSAARDSSLQAEEKLRLLVGFDEVFGLGLGHLEPRVLSEGHATLIREREGARRRKDWILADAIRDQLLREGVRLKDRPDGTDWEVVD